MKQKSVESRIVSDRALEIIMHDVFDGLVELSLESAYGHTTPGFEVIEITPKPPRPQRLARSKAPLPNGHEAEIIDFPQLRRATG